MRIKRAVQRIGLSTLAILTGGVSLALAFGDPHSLTVSTRDNQIAFDQESIVTTINEPVAVTFRNNADAQRHAWVLIDGDAQTAARIVARAAQAGDLFISEREPQVTAATVLVAPGQSQQVQFVLRHPGTFTYLCVFPGHYNAGMSGQLIAREKSPEHSSSDVGSIPELVVSAALCAAPPLFLLLALRGFISLRWFTGRSRT